MSKRDDFINSLKVDVTPTVSAPTDDKNTSLPEEHDAPTRELEHEVQTPFSSDLPEEHDAPTKELEHEVQTPFSSDDAMQGIDNSATQQSDIEEGEKYEEGEEYEESTTEEESIEESEQEEDGEER